jgi:tRNA-dihydrouridine synthase A
MLDRRLSVAPMMDYTDRYCRYFHRLLSRRILLYTEMVTTGALIHGDRQRFLRFDPSEHPVALQLGGSDPAQLAVCAAMGERWGYDEINLNVGCPSDRVQSGRFGACLMAEPALVAECVRAMTNAVSLPVTVKHRIGIDERDSYGELADFVGTLADAGCNVFIVHARKAWLQGLSPKENREIPPLRYDVVERLKRDFPRAQVVVNGGITTLAQSASLLRYLDGVMIGREAYHNPWILAQADARIFGQAPVSRSRRQVLEAFLPFVQRELADGVPLGRLSRHILGLYQGVPGARAWRRYISERAHLPGADADLLRRAADLVRESPADGGSRAGEVLSQGA